MSRITRENLDNACAHINLQLRKKKSPYRVIIQKQYNTTFLYKGLSRIITTGPHKGKEEILPSFSPITTGTHSEVYEVLQGMLSGIFLILNAKDDMKRERINAKSEKERNAYMMAESRKAHEANKKADMEGNV